MTNRTHDPYTHLIFSDYADPVINSINTLLYEPDWMESPMFSDCRYHYVHSTKKNNNGIIPSIKIASATIPNNTPQITKERLFGVLPPLPNILRATKLPEKFISEIPIPKLRKAGPISPLYESEGRIKTSGGFYRHIFNLIDITSEDLNNNDSSSGIVVSQDEKRLFELQKENCRTKK